MTTSILSTQAKHPPRLARERALMQRASLMVTHVFIGRCAFSKGLSAEEKAQEVCRVQPVATRSAPSTKKI